MKGMKENSMLQLLCPEKRLSNHSLRKTVARKLKAEGVQKSEITTITGNRQKKVLSDNSATSLAAKKSSVKSGHIELPFNLSTSKSA